VEANTVNCFKGRLHQLYNKSRGHYRVVRVGVGRPGFLRLDVARYANFQILVMSANVS
jgi:hypothetical protein